MPPDSVSKPLTIYNSKRDFTKTPEPKGTEKYRKSNTPRFLVQKHAARRLHYDFRLEADGVLLSWAVTKGPSADPSQKRLAVRTEDHPLSYADFEGSIPKGEYGGGTVMLWDQGSWEPLHDPNKGLQQGKLHFRLQGTRMRGGWVLVRMRKQASEKRENWLLIKERDKYALDEPDALTEQYQGSVESGRSMDEIAAAAVPENTAPETAAQPKASVQKTKHTAAYSQPEQSRQANSSRREDTELVRQKKAIPAFQKPQLATLVADAPDGDDWLHEAKFDGYRCLAAINAGKVRCFTRSGKDWTDKFAVVAQALAGLSCKSALLDGEIIAASRQSQSSGSAGSAFSALQTALSEGGAIEFVAFDILQLDGVDRSAVAQIDRKELLRALLEDLPKDAPVHYSDHVVGNGPEVFRYFCEAGHEGIISKRTTAAYQHRRSRSWLKVKCSKRQEFIIGGYSPSDKRGRAFASLLVGSYDAGEFCYRGRVGTGFSAQILESIAGMLHALKRKSAPFKHVPAAIARTAIWVTPQLIAEIEFTELTADGQIRHGVFVGLREDKPAKEIKLETPDADENRLQNELHGVRLSHADRVVYPTQGITKLDLARYYAAVGERMLPLIADFPLSLMRCPQGSSAKCFFQKHATEGLPDPLKPVRIVESDGESKDYLYVDGPAGLVAGVQMGTLEFHIWGARRDNIEKPARLVFDLDPDASLDFKAVKVAAALVRGGLELLGINSLPLVTGGKGVHVVTPLRRTAEWSQVRSFAKAFAQHMAREFPNRYTATMSKQKRRGKIFIDWLRNERGATAIAPYSTRARQGAPVATPVSWEELERLDSAAGFSTADVLQRMRKVDPWSGYAELQTSITKNMLQALQAA